MHRWMMRTCSRWGDRPCVDRFSYRHILAMAAEMDSHRGSIRCHDRVIVSEHNSARMLARILTLWRWGCVPCLIPPQLPADGRRHCEDQIRGTQGDEGLILFTSATSGKRPKGVRLSHANLEAHREMLRQHVSADLFHSGDRTLAVLPWTHCYGLMGECFSALDRGVHLHTMGGRFHPMRFLWGMHRASPTVLFVVPRILDTLFATPSWVWGGSRLRLIVSGGAYLNPDRKKEFMAKHAIPILQGYGMTEMSPMVSLQNRLDAADGTDVGELLPHVTVSIAEDGEILVDSPARCLGYLGEPDHSHDRPHPTGDWGRLDGTTLHVEGRVGDRVKTSNGRFHSLRDIERDVRRLMRENHPSIPIRDLCLWEYRDGFRGVAQKRRGVPESQVHTIWENRPVHLLLIDGTVASPEDGTLTLKGEKSRRRIHQRFSIYFGKLKL